MKVLHVIDSLGFGGAEMSLSRILPELERRGVRSEVAFFQALPHQVPIPPGIPVETFPGSRQPSLRQASRWLNGLVADANLIHTHLNFSTLAGRSLKASALPIVTTLHNIWYGNTFIRSYRWPGQAKVRWMRWRERRTLGHRTYLIAVSRSVADAFAGYAGIDPARIRILSNAIDGSHFARAPSSPPQKSFPLMAMGRLSPEKDHATILHALQLVPKKHQPAFHLFGQGSFLPALKAMAADMHLPVVFEGLAQNTPEIFASSQVFINASMIEGQALVVLEALAHGLPCVLSDIPPHREVAGDAALYFPVGNAKACADQLQRLLTDSSLRSSLSTMSRGKAESARPTSVTEHLCHYYEDVLSGKVLPAVDNP